MHATCSGLFITSYLRPVKTIQPIFAGSPNSTHSPLFQTSIITLTNEKLRPVVPVNIFNYLSSNFRRHCKTQLEWLIRAFLEPMTALTLLDNLKADWSHRIYILHSAAPSQKSLNSQSEKEKFIKLVNY